MLLASNPLTNASARQAGERPRLIQINRLSTEICEPPRVIPRIKGRSMNKDFLALEQDYGARSRVLHKEGGAPLKAFRDLVQAAGTDGALSHKQKELIALAISIAIRCEGCILFHSRACVRLGVTRPELLDMVGVAVEMGGGPSAVYGAQALACFEQMANGAGSA
jgi:AhpD family alkylhydroperoxidase